MLPHFALVFKNMAEGKKEPNVTPGVRLKNRLSFFAKEGKLTLLVQGAPTVRNDFNWPLQSARAIGEEGP